MTAPSPFLGNGGGLFAAEPLFLVALFLFLLSSLASAAATRTESRFSRSAAKAAYAAGAALVGAALVAHLGARGTWMIGTFFEGILLSIAVLGLLFAAAAFRTAAPLGTEFLAPISLFLGALAFVKSGGGAAPGADAAPQGLGLHIFFMFLGVGAFSISFLFSVLFLAQDYFIRTKRIGRLFFELPPLELTGRLNFSFLTVGTAAWAAGVASGVAAWRLLEAGAALLVEPTVLFTVAMLGLYVAILWLRSGPLERSRRAAVVSVVSYSLLMALVFAAHAARGPAG
jgi:ABC-type uncharacterized transport system permease subunit